MYRRLWIGKYPNRLAYPIVYTTDFPYCLPHVKPTRGVRWHGRQRHFWGLNTSVKCACVCVAGGACHTHRHRYCIAECIHCINASASKYMSATHAAVRSAGALLRCRWQLARWLLALCARNDSQPSMVTKGMVTKRCWPCAHATTASQAWSLKGKVTKGCWPCAHATTASQAWSLRAW